MKGPQFVEYFAPVIEALKELGGSGRPTEVVELIASKQNPDDKMFEQLQNGQTRFTNRVNWARFYLVKAGFLDASQRGIWSLTEKGLHASLTHKESVAIFKKVHEQFRSDAATTTQTESIDEQPYHEDSPPSTTPTKDDFRTRLLDILKNLPASGFERLCQRLLRESGFEKVEVTGRTNDGGIDGKGILRINPFVSFNVYFQCKRYSGSVGPSIIRDFRGSIMGRADKGIILTTGSFTTEASKEAIRDGAIPIELVDGEKLLDMMEQLEFGVKPKTVVVYEVDQSFFEEFTIR